MLTRAWQNTWHGMTQVDEERLMRKFYELIATQGLTKKVMKIVKTMKIFGIHLSSKKLMDPYLQFCSGNVGEFSESTPSAIQRNSSQPNDNAVHIYKFDSSGALFLNVVALLIKWRGKWQAAIKCARADWPLSTVKAKPTHDRKKYLAIFFPRKRNYSWADVLLIRPINEFPEPVAYRTHKVGMKMVKDLTFALSETARSVMVWKEFAMEASRCKGYSDFGRMLLKLHNMVASISLLLSLSLEWNEEQTEEQGGAESPPVVANDPCAQSSEKKEDNPVNESDITFIASTKHS
ncbi:Histone-lysine N-methyltransferase SUVR5 [Camellia lanceoleosa]|uniref:Histone-lysine N-methyltransferase SUVR5 n=1 Tax=Camellia lanceoleosa TaxID=1840588 RepID=A0ACC0GWF6_9ERIC|nr:Histone-lysine N-methyltransferase SUVR5 [Camellia lanceoleosa]